MCPLLARFLCISSMSICVQLPAARKINGQCMDVLSGGGGGCCGPMVRSAVSALILPVQQLVLNHPNLLQGKSAKLNTDIGVVHPITIHIISPSDLP
jgi:hypothetical protein